jgi:hypothetical protein
MSDTDPSSGLLREALLNVREFVRVPRLKTEDWAAA